MAEYFSDISKTLSKASLRCFPVLGMTFSYALVICLYKVDISSSSDLIFASISARSMLDTSRYDLRVPV